MKQTFFRRGTKFRPQAMLLAALIGLLGFAVTEDQASAQAWSLTKAQRQAYLNYYAPVILKRADESSSQAGLDWLTNFDFDRDGNFSNNRVNWLKINQYVTAAASGSTSYSHWRIRPTLYTALIEYMEGSQKSLALLYHVYNAEDKDGSAIHDWERVEIVVRGVTGTPGGSGEYVNHITDTHHHDHIMRRYYDSGLNFMQTTRNGSLVPTQPSLTRIVLLGRTSSEDMRDSAPTATAGAAEQPAGTTTLTMRSGGSTTSSSIRAPLPPIRRIVKATCMALGRPSHSR